MQKLANGDRDVHPNFSRSVLEYPDIFIESSDYRSQLAPYRERFAEEQIKIVFFEDFRNDQSESIKQLLSFLEVNADVPDCDQELHLNVSEGKLVFDSKLILLRRAQWLAPAKRLLPDGWKQSIAERFFRRRMSERPVWDPDVKQLVTKRLRDSSERLCRDCGKPEDFWGWDE